jgi:DNA ligase (NAD+)
VTPAEAKNRHAQLVEEIRRHDRAYYVEGRQIITDREYDQLFKELHELEKNFPDLVTPESPTQRVGGAPSESFARVKHLLPMLSLDKITASDHPTKDEEPDRDKRNRAQDENTLAELYSTDSKKVTFDSTIRKQLGRDRVEYIIEPKVDGVSISVHYRHGKLALGVTRGDGIEGDDITANLKTVRGIPLELHLKNPPALLEVRGEAYISIKEFDALNAKLAAAGEKPFPNARNATAGTLKQLDPRLVAQRPIRAVFYATGAVDGIEFEKHSEMLEALARYGLPTQKLWWVCDGIEEVLKIYADKVVAHYDEDHDLRRQLPYEIDGIVLKVNTLADWPHIPGRSRAPGYAIVHKPVPWITPAETVLKDITVQVGRTGVLTPVAELEPVFVQGSTISRATLHNEDEIRRKDIRIGDTVVIRKAGMVIPEIFEVVKTKRPPGAKEFDLFNHVGGKCPACGSPIAKEKLKSSRNLDFGGASSTSPKSKAAESQGLAELAPPTDAEVAWRCQNVAGCPAQQTRRVEYFAQRKALDIESLGGIVAEKLVERGLVKEPLDLFDLKLEQLGKLNLGTDDEPRVFGEKNATKVLEALQRAKTAPLNRWLFAIGIPNVGEVTAIDIAKFHDDLEQVASSKVLEEIQSLGDLYGALTATSPFVDDISDEEKSSRQEPFKKKKQELLDFGNRLVKAGWVKKSGNWTKLEQKGSKAVPKFLPLVDYVPAENVLSYFKSKLGKDLLKRLRELQIHPISPSKATSQGKIFGKTFVLTGTLPSLSRDETSALIRDAGGNVTGSVSKNTDYLLAGDSTGLKLDKAKELGVKIISEKEFLNLLGSHSPPAKTNEKKQTELL